jgi:hypothetical protein
MRKLLVDSARARSDTHRLDEAEAYLARAQAIHRELLQLKGERP